MIAYFGAGFAVLSSAVLAVSPFTDVKTNVCNLDWYVCFCVLSLPLSLVL